jgi:Putative adhesin
MLKHLVVGAALAVGAQTLVAAESTKEVQKTAPLQADGRVSLEAYKGSIRITGWDRPEVAVQARVESDDGCGDSKYQAEMVRDTEVRIDGGGSSLSIESDYSRVKDRHWGFFFGGCSNLPFVHYTISMPRSARLEIKDYKSEITLNDLGAEIRLNTYKGEVRAAGLGGPMRLDTYKGDVRMGFTKVSGDMRFETYKGQIELTLPKDARFSVAADVSGRGSLDSDFPVLLRTGSHSRSHIEASANGGGPELSLHTYRGTFKLRSS